MASGYINTQLLLDNHLDIIKNYVQPSELDQYDSRPCTLFTFTRQPTEVSNCTDSLCRKSNCATNARCSSQSSQVGHSSDAGQAAKPPMRVVCRSLLFHFCFSCNPWQPSGSAVVTLLKHEPSIELVDESIVPVELEDNEPGPCFGVPHQLNGLL